jgi:hypothetical protein
MSEKKKVDVRFDDELEELVPVVLGAVAQEKGIVGLTQGRDSKGSYDCMIGNYTSN